MYTAKAMLALVLTILAQVVLLYGCYCKSADEEVIEDDSDQKKIELQNVREIALWPTDAAAEGLTR